MGWYHHELASGKDPFADERKQQSDSNGTCPDGMCASGQAREQQQHQQEQHKQEVVACVTKLSSSVQSVVINTPPHDPKEKEDIYQDNGPVYHLCQKKNWISAIENEESYYPPTFWLDGKFTRACCKKDTLVDTANEYYQKTEGDWICIEMNAILLRQMGIIIACHYAPEISKNQQPIQCLKLYSGISVHIPGLVQNIYPLGRSNMDGKFMYLDSTPDTSIPKCVVSSSSSMQQAHKQQEKVKNQNDTAKMTTKKVTSSTKLTPPPLEEAAPVVASEEKKKRGLLWLRK